MIKYGPPNRMEVYDAMINDYWLMEKEKDADFRR